MSAIQEGQYVVLIEKKGLRYITGHRCATAADGMAAAGSMVMAGKRVFVARIMGEIKTSVDKWHPLWKEDK